jgi:hypothetical protein
MGNPGEAPAAGPAAAPAQPLSSPAYSLALFSFVAALLFVLLPAPACAPTHGSGSASSSGGGGGGGVARLKPLSYWGADGEKPLEGPPLASPTFRLPPLTPNNTAYSMIALGGYAYHLSSLVTVHSIRRWDKERDIVIHTTHKDLPPADIVAAMTALGARYNVVSEMDYENVGDPLYHRCGMFFGCWLKFFVWGMTQYAAVLNVDTDYIMLQSQARAFDMFGKMATSPYDVAGVPDLVVAFSHPDSSTADVFNGGWFMAAPSEDAFRRMVKFAQGPAPWKWGEMLTLNTFSAAHGGQWHRMPVGFNTFPLLLNARAPFYIYDGPNFNSVFGLHYAGKSKVKPGTTANECGGYDGAGDCTICCWRWVEEEQLTKKFLDDLTLGVDWGVEHHKLDPKEMEGAEMPH